MVCFSSNKKISVCVFKYSLLLLSIKSAYAQDYFNPAALTNGAPGMANVDLSAFENGGQAEGNYNVDIYINDQLVLTKTLAFKNQKTADGKLVLTPVLDVKGLSDLGVKTDSFFAGMADDAVVDLNQVAGASSEFDFSQRKLNLHIPQIALEGNPRDFVPVSQWDEGINALLLNYSFTGSQDYSRDSHTTEQSQYANLRPGLNLGPWRVRNYSTWTNDSDGESHWDSAYSYISRDVSAIKGQLLAGESNSPSDVFDSVSFKGVQISSDDDMLPDSMKGFAPVIHGIAKSNAQVSVEQNGYIIYKTNVPAGPFEINDLYPTGGSGDLYVTIKESDGSEQHLIVPYASVPVLQREGHLKYDLTMGRTRTNGSEGADENFLEATALYGLPHNITLYGGIESTLDNDVYRAIQIGSGLNLGDAGALSLDVTNAVSQLAKAGSEDSTSSTGQSWRIRYSKDIQTTGTNFTVAGYRYSTQGYYSLQDVLNSYDDDDDNQQHEKDRTDVSVSQDIGYGAVSLSLYNEAYWNDKHTTSLSIGYNNSYNNISYGINYSYTINADHSQDDDADQENSNDRQLALNISIPLDKFLPSTYATYNMNAAKEGGTTHTVGLNGSALEHKNLFWSVQEGYASDDKETSSNINATYDGAWADVNAGYSYDQHMRRANYGIQGGILVHKNGITLSQPMNDTVILVKAPGASDVPVNNQTGVTTDYRGYAVVPYASPYHKNEVSLNADNLGDKNIELLDTSKMLVPTRGAVVRAEYKTNIGYRALMILTRTNHTAVPFGSIVHESSNDSHGSFVGSGGQVWVTGLKEQGTLLVSWGNSKAQQCRVNYRIPHNTQSAGIQILKGQCL